MTTASLAWPAHASLVPLAQVALQRSTLSGHCVEAVRRVCEALPRVPSLGFETTSAVGMVDLAVPFTPRDPAYALLQRHDIWPRLCGNTSASRLSLAGWIRPDSVWLEYDLGQCHRPALQLRPNVFLSLGTSGGTLSDVADDLLAALWASLGLGEEPLASRGLTLSRLTRDTGGVRIGQIGVMAARPGVPLRVNLAGSLRAIARHASPLLDGQERRRLARLGAIWAGMRLPRSIPGLSLDIASDGSARVQGLELRPPRVDATLSPWWSKVLTRAPEAGLLPAEVASCLRRWPGTDEASESAATPLGRATGLGAVHRGLHHVKLVSDDTRPAMKVYYGLRAMGAAMPALLPVARRPKSAGALVAATAGAQFLERAQKVGLWLDYHLASGQGTHWPTAFVGAHLAPAARGLGLLGPVRAWHALVTSRRPDGWGYNDNVPADADSTAWAAILARLVGKSGSQAAAEARRSLAYWRVPGGGYSTFRAGDRIADVVLADGDLSGWRSAHCCVTAAATVAATRPRRDAVRFILDTQQDDGSWPGYWWLRNEYPTYIALRALSRVNDVSSNEISRTWERAVQYLVDHETVADLPERERAFATACRLHSLSLAARRGSVPTRVTSALARSLCGMQAPRGSWEGGAVLRIPGTDDDLDTASRRSYAPGGRTGNVAVDGNGFLSTAMAVAALWEFATP